AQREAAYATYDPNHRLKWRSHELLHRRVGFFWRPDLTRFEAYLGARLSELLPVVHWYGFDEIHRPHCAQHQDEVLRQQMCSACIAEQRPVWTHAVLPVDEDRARARATECLDHLRCELQAVVEEHD